jgi:integral membrane protein (TIGR01906 family)
VSAPAVRLGRGAVVAAVVLALAIPPVLLGNAVRVIASDWFLRHEYAGTPASEVGMTDAERLELGRTGLASVRPGGTGIEALRQTRLDGAPAFTEREVAHMDDVRTVFAGLYRLQVVALVVALLLVVLLLAAGATRVLALGLAGGGALTVALGAFVGIYAAIGFDSFFAWFHGLFFEGSTWEFPSSSTLIRIYPEWFWQAAVAWLAGLVLAQALVLIAGGAWAVRRERRRAVAPVAAPS